MSANPSRQARLAEIERIVRVGAFPAAPGIGNHDAIPLLGQCPNRVVPEHARAHAAEARQQDHRSSSAGLRPGQLHAIEAGESTRTHV